MTMPISEGYLPTPDGHQLYYAEFGNIGAPAVVVLHGGPGSSANPGMLDWFNLDHWHVILFDQRGSGKSLPTGTLEHNTTAHLVDDVERLRQHVNVTHWTVVGGSWGAYLALAYAAKYASSIDHLVLRGTFLPSELQLDWFFQHIQALVPSAWEHLTATMNDEEKAAVLHTLAARLLQGDKVQQADAAQRWGHYERHIMIRMMHGKGESQTQQEKASRVASDTNSAQGAIAQETEAEASRQHTPGSDTRSDVQRKANIDARLIHKYRIQAHYLRHAGFVDLPTLLEQLQAMACAVTLLHGTHDWICPAANVHLLQRILPNATVNWIEGGTHTPSDPLILAALTDAMARLVRERT